jgi:ribosome biogenesis GTPase
MNIHDLGWNNFFQQHFEQLRDKDDLLPCRVSMEHRNLYHVLSDVGELVAEVTGKFRHQTQARADFPSVGDWVAVKPRPGDDRASIHAVLPRKSSFSRKVAGLETEEQILSANIDTVFLVNGLDGDFNLRRIERYLTLSWESGVNPVLILNKADVCPDLEERLSQVESVAFGLPIHTVSAKQKQGLEVLREYLGKGQTAVFLGSSGVGKSTLINSLLGSELLKVREIREDDSRGRHTTTARQMIFLPGGGIVIDTPGMRSVILWAEEEGLKQAFGDIEELASRCRFSDCKHESEPGCAIKQALEDGTLNPKRFHSYVKQQKELMSLALRKSQKEYRRATREWDKKVRRFHQEKKKLRKEGLL